MLFISIDLFTVTNIRLFFSWGCSLNDYLVSCSLRIRKNRALEPFLIGGVNLIWARPSFDSIFWYDRSSQERVEVTFTPSIKMVQEHDFPDSKTIAH
jgi:hypothetical protein